MTVVFGFASGKEDRRQQESTAVPKQSKLVAEMAQRVKVSSPILLSSVREKMCVSKHILTGKIHVKSLIVLMGHVWRHFWPNKIWPWFSRAFQTKIVLTRGNRSHHILFSVEIAKQFFIKKMRRMIFKKNGDYGLVKKNWTSAVPSGKVSILWVRRLKAPDTIYKTLDLNVWSKKQKLKQLFGMGRVGLGCIVSRSAFPPPMVYGSPCSAPGPSICTQFAAFLRSSLVFANYVQHFWSLTSYLLGICYLLDDLHSTHTPSKYHICKYIYKYNNIYIYTYIIYIYGNYILQYIYIYNII